MTPVIRDALYRGDPIGISFGDPPGQAQVLLCGASGAASIYGADIVRVARTFIGTRYRHQGRSREGVDCIGLPVCVRADLGLLALDAVGYTRASTGSEMLDYCKANMVEVSRVNLQLGDVLVQMDGTVRHMAIVADCAYGGFSIIHAWLPNRRVVECRLDDYFMQTVRGCFRFPEVAQ